MCIRSKTAFRNKSKMAQYLHVSFENQVSVKLKFILLYGPIHGVKVNINYLQESYD